jgi:hypothetical protein
LSIETVAEVRRDKAYTDNDLLQYRPPRPPVLPSGPPPFSGHHDYHPAPRAIKRFLLGNLPEFFIDICRNHGKLWAIQQALADRRSFAAI